MTAPRGMGRVQKTPSGTVVDEKYLCYYCGTSKPRTKFYASTDPINRVGIIPYCKDCIERIARNYNENYKEFGDVTKISLQTALERLDLPFLEEVWEMSHNEVHNPSLKKPKTNMWAAYIKNIKLPKYNGLRWRDGDLFNERGANFREDSEDKIASTMTPEVLDECKTNKRDLIRLIGYDPFANYPAEQDLPVLYAQIISFIDEETKNDGMKMNAVIQIVQAFNQIQKLNDAINELLADTKKLNSNNGTIKQHSDTISKLLSGANALAKDNGINTIVPM